MSFYDTLPNDVFRLVLRSLFFPFSPVVFEAAYSSYYMALPKLCRCQFWGGRERDGGRAREGLGRQKDGGNEEEEVERA
jgi:hypothetical protein